MSLYTDETEEQIISTGILKEYYARFLSDVRNLSTSSVKHYLDALNNISKRLKEKGFVEENIYEIKDLPDILKAKELLLSDPDFVDLDSRGNNMYSSGLNNYIRFAAGENFEKAYEKVKCFDMPVKANEPREVKATVWPRSEIIRSQALSLASYKCEINFAHETFITETERKPYMEGHHAIPMRKQGIFDCSLDIYANILCLCPICHRRIHYGLIKERKDMICKIYEDRAERLNECGIRVSKSEFLQFAL